MGKYVNPTRRDLRIEAATKAFETGSLIWSQAQKRYYTPREFVDSDITVMYKYIDSTRYYDNITLFKAEYAVKYEIGRLKKAQSELESFMQRVLTAFELHPIKKESKSNK